LIAFFVSDDHNHQPADTAAVSPPISSSSAVGSVPEATSRAASSPQNRQTLAVSGSAAKNNLSQVQYEVNSKNSHLSIFAHHVRTQAPHQAMICCPPP